MFGKQKNRYSLSDRRSFSDIPSQGSARWMTEEDKKFFFNVAAPDATREMIYGRFDENNVLSFRYVKGRASGNKHTIVYGGSGLGKTTNIVLPDLMQTMRREESFVVLDPKGECFRMLASLCGELDYNVVLINLLDLKRSMFWNCLEEVLHPDTGRLDSQRLNEFVNIYVSNMSPDAKPFWNTNTANLVKGIIGCLAYERESRIANLYATLYRQITGVSENDHTVKMIRESMASFAWIEEQICHAALMRHIGMEQVNRIIQRIRNDLPDEFTFAGIVDFLLNFDANAHRLAGVPAWHEGAFFYKTFIANDTKEISGGAVQGALKAFSIFSDREIREVFSNSQIHMRDINKKKTAMFVITDDKTNTKQALTSLIFTYIFKNAMQNSDDALHSGRKTIPLTMMLEEFASIGTMFGNADEFCTNINTARSRGITVKMILQTHDQLVQLYGEHGAENIQGACSTTLFLGCNDLGTAVYLSKLIGDATITLRSETRQKGPIFEGHSGGSVNYSAVRAPLCGVETLRGWNPNYLLIIRQGTAAVAAVPVYPWFRHPFVRSGAIPIATDENGFITPSRTITVNSFIPPLGTRMADVFDKRAVSKTAETDIYRMIQSIPPQKPER